MSEEQYANAPNARNIKPIDYLDCSNAVLMMWMENIITDDEYNKIMNKIIESKLYKEFMNK